MNNEQIREYCISKPGVIESLPFNDTALVFKVSGRIFTLLGLEGEPGINLKYNQRKALKLPDNS